MAEIIRKLGISEQTFYRWKKRLAGLGIAELRRENRASRLSSARVFPNDQLLPEQA